MTKLFYMILCLAGFAANAAELMIEDFTGPGKTVWTPSVNSSNRMTMSGGTGKLAFDGRPVGRIDESGVWFSVMPKSDIRLNPYRYLLFRARSTDGKSRPFAVYINRELEPGNTASFYNITELTPEWRDYNLKLERGDRVNFGKGIFALARVSPGGSSDLSEGGRLVDFTFASSEPVRMEMASLRLSDRPVNPEQAEIDRIAGDIGRHERFMPYAIPAKDGGRTFVLAENGATRYSVGAAADAVSQFAASELVRYLNAATGAEFNTGGGDGEPVIRLQIRDQEPEDGFSVTVAEDGNIDIAGNNGRGLVYGVYDFLERVAGCRFFGPFDYLEAVPRHDKLTVPEFALSDAPQMNYRFPHYCNDTRAPGALEHIYRMADYCAKNRYNVELQTLKNPYGASPEEQRRNAEQYLAARGGMIPLPERWGHNFHIWLPPEQYFAGHPEYYCYERATGKWRAENAQLCTTSPGVVRELAEIAGKQFKERPGLTHFGVMQEDGHRLWCQCDRCLAVNPSGSNLGSATDNNLYLANAVAAAIGPVKRVMTYAYSNTASPPKAVKPLPNVDILYCQYGGADPSCLPWEDAAAGEILKWAELSNGNIHIYSYNYLTPFYTFPNAASHTAGFRFYNLLGIQGSTQETGEFWSSVMPYQYYLSARLAWNPWFDENEFRRDYFHRLYGPAAAPMEQLYRLLDRNLSLRENQVPVNQWYAYTAIPAAELEQARALLREARHLADGDRRIEAAIHAQGEGVEYLSRASAALLAIRRYREEPSRQNRSAAVVALDELERQAVSMVEGRLGGPGHISYLRQVVDEITKTSAGRSELERNFTILKNLNDGWKFAPDAKAEGDELKYFAADFGDHGWQEIKAGDNWENQGFPGLDGVGWYRRQLEIPAGHERLMLYFGAADERAWVYLDGKYIGGHHEGDIGVLWEEPFAVALPDNTGPGMHQLTVKVIDSTGAGGLWGDVYLVKKK